MNLAEDAPAVWPLSRAVVVAVEHAAALHAGVSLSDEAAEAIARAAIEQADEVCYVRAGLAAGEMWERQDVRDSLRQHQRRQIFAEMADKGWLPVAWPQERVERMPSPGGFVSVTVELSVPVRRAVP